MARKPSQGKNSDSVTGNRSSVKDPRRAAVAALMRLSAEMPYGAVRLTDIAREADVSLADLRDLYPSKGAILGGLMRTIDREVLEGTTADMDDESIHDRVLDIMMRRLDALMPYKEGLRSIHRTIRADPAFAVALNQAALNSWRYMLEAAGVETTGSLGALRVQGAVMVFARVFPIWLDDEDDGARTLAALDRELKRGEQVMGWASAMHRITSPIRGFARAVCERGREKRRHDKQRGDSDVQYF